MTTPFETRELGESGFIRRLLGRTPPENAYVEIGNLLAHRDWSELHEGHLADVFFRHGVRRADRVKLISLFRKAVAHFVGDLHLDESELRRLEQLRCILGLSHRDVDVVTREVALEAYSRELDEAAADGRLSDDEKRHLDNVASALRLDDRDALDRIRMKGSQLLHSGWQSALSDERLSPEEERALEAMARDFGVDAALDTQSRELARRYRIFWLIENGEAPVYESPVALQRNERCHYACPAERYEMRTRTVRYNYGGPTVRFKVAKGLYFRAGSIRVEPMKEEVMTRLDTGTLVITDKRLIFRGTGKNTTVRLANVLAFTPYSDAVEIEKSSGRNMIFKVSDPEMVSVLLGALLANG